ncbi:MAG: PaaI family thioesterase [Rhodospirillaceae bacterium]|nr:PaaI family thioesterase [Rhodospirillaceae bacterium]
MTDANFEARVKLIQRHVAAQGFMALVGAKLGEITPGACVITVAKRPEVLQQFGMFHGGVTAFLVDNATTIAAATVMAADQLALTAEFKLNFLSPALGDELMCRARVIKPGRSTTVVAADVYCRANGAEKHTATALASVAMLDGAALPPIGPPVKP